MAQVSTNTVTRMEAGEDLKPRTISAVQHALETAGIIFIDENGDGPGVRLKKTTPIAEQIEALEDKVSAIPDTDAPSPEAGMNTMRKALAEDEITKLKNQRAEIGDEEPE